MQYHLAYCSSCRADWEVGVEELCPDCRRGGLIRTTYSPGPITFCDEGVFREDGSGRPWQRQWYRTKQRFVAVKAIYQPNGFRDQDSAQATIEDFFDHCLRVGDWLWDDKPETGLEKHEVQKYIREDRFLKICKGVANTAKHRGRDRNGIYAAVKRFHDRDDRSASAVIEWSVVGQEERPPGVDALELAAGCVASWMRYLKTNGLRLSDVMVRRSSPTEPG